MITDLDYQVRPEHSKDWRREAAYRPILTIQAQQPDRLSLFQKIPAWFGPGISTQKIELSSQAAPRF